MLNKNNFKNNEWLPKLKEIMAKFDLEPKNVQKYLIAFTHPSYSHENSLDYNYEQYEFLGDSAISWVITKFLFHFLKSNEGEMSITKSKLVSSDILSKATQIIGLDQLIIVGNGLQDISKKIMENIFESFIGAIADDLGIEYTEKIIKKCIIDRYLNNEIQVSKPYKTLIQEALIRGNKSEIRYVLENSNQDEIKYVKLIYDNCIYGYGKGETQKIAEEDAARDAYIKITK
ncbi:MAG: ribonuclease III [Ureaplasma sp.]|nr:ribonuclease III [Ureaplasma sp.]MDE7222082.1 ribonuclease III [Ureaplasma sp.]